MRFALNVEVTAAIVALVAAVAGVVVLVIVLTDGGDDDGSGDPDASRTPFIAPEPYTTEEVLTELGEIIEAVRNPDPDVVDDTDVGASELEQRAEDTISGTAQVPGLEEVRAQLTGEDRILAGEYLHNTLVEVLAPPFGESDATTIPADEMAEIDPLGAYAPRGEDFEVSVIYRDIIRRIIELWYRI